MYTFQGYLPFILSGLCEYHGSSTWRGRSESSTLYDYWIDQWLNFGLFIRVTWQRGYLPKQVQILVHFSSPIWTLLYSSKQEQCISQYILASTMSLYWRVTFGDQLLAKPITVYSAIALSSFTWVTFWTTWSHAQTSRLYSGRSLSVPTSLQYLLN